jgi:hypothetical protein
VVARYKSIELEIENVISMGRVYVLRIDSEKEKYDTVSQLIGVMPTSIEAFWDLSIEEDSIPQGSSLYGTALSYFLNLIEKSISNLNQIGVAADDISIWYYYEYEGECNMEFSPDTLKRLGVNGITLCISCWKK